MVILLQFSASRHEPKGLTIIQLWIKSGLNAGKAALLLGLPRRSRTILKSMLLPVHQLLLPQSTIEILLTLASNDICSEKYDDCKVNFSNRILLLNFALNHIF